MYFCSKLVSRVAIYISVMGLACMALPALAEHPFPGKGDKSKWERAGVPYNQGLTLYRTGAYDKSILKYKEAIDLYPFEYSYFGSLGLAYMKKGELESACEAFRQSNELNPRNWENWSNLGSAYKHQGKRQDALDAYTKALQFNPPAKARQLIQQNIAYYKSDLKSAPANGAASNH